MRQSIITVEEAKTKGRPIGKIDNDKLMAIITEVEQTIIRPSLGDDLYVRLISDDELTPEEKTLLSGGSYQEEQKTRVFVGLKVAIAYFVYAQNVMSGDFESTRFGMVLKNGDYSDKMSSRERSDVYNNITNTANAYLQDCIRYCHIKGIRTGQGKNLHTTSGCVIHKIGGTRR